MAVKSTIVFMVHFDADEFCNTHVYPQRHGEFAVSMQTQERRTGFMNVMVQGDHTNAADLWENWKFSKWCQSWPTGSSICGPC